MVTPSAPPIPMYWIRSERDSKLWNPAFDRMLEVYDGAASSLGMAIEWVSVDDIVVGRSGVDPEVRVAGRPVHPHRCFFHTMLLTSPKARGDLLRHLTTYRALEAAEFFVTVPAMHSIINDDKVLSCMAGRAGDAFPIPTVRLGGSVARSPSVVDAAVGLVGLPALVKPASWDGGNSVFVVHTTAQLNAVLALAGAARLTMLVQPWLGAGTVDYRVYCIDGEPTKSLERKPIGDAVAGNMAQGGRVAVVDVPEQLVEPARRIATAVGLPYLGVDFLVTENHTYLSEIEADGGTVAGGIPLTTMRFGAHRRAFDRFVAGERRPRWHPAREHIYDK